MPRNRPIQCLFVGDADHREFCSAVAWLSEQTQFASCLTVSEAMATARSLSRVDMLVLAQSRPGMYSSAEVETLHRQWPLAKLCALLGYWCEGEGRSGRPWPGVWRIPACDFVARMSGMLRTSNVHSRTGGWLLPRLASDAERFYSEASIPLSSQSGNVRIAARTRADFDGLADAVRHIGFTPLWQPSVGNLVTATTGASVQRLISQTERDEPPCAAIWDAVRGDAGEWRWIQNFCREIAPVPVLITLGFPRDDDFRRAGALSEREFGNPNHVAVLAKPARLAELCGHLVRMTVPTATTDAGEIGWQQDSNPPLRAAYDAGERPRSKSA